VAIDINPNVSPRIVLVRAPLTTISIQQLHDQIRDWEDEPPNLAYPAMVQTSGKEALGGGVTVGLTAELQNAVVAFEGRTTSDSAGTATIGNSVGRILIDSAATFIADGIIAGDSVFNTTDGSVTSVISVDSETQITHYPLADGTDNDWDIGDAYKIWNKIQCEVNGGNLVAVDNLGANISPFLPTAFTHVVRTSSSSATLQELSSIQFSSFEGHVTVDVVDGVPGTTFPIGTGESPVNNIADAITIASTRGLTAFHIVGNITLDASAVITNARIYGDSEIHSTITVNAAANVTDTIFERCVLAGTLDGGNIVQNTHVANLTFIDGAFHKSLLLTGTITLNGSVPANFIECWSGAIATSTPIIDMNGTGQELAITDYSGAIKIINLTSNQTVLIDLNSGSVELDSTVTAGTFTIRGVGKLIDNTTGTATVDSDGLMSKDTISRSVWDELITPAAHNIPKSAGVVLRTSGGIVIRDNLAQGSGTGNNQIQLDIGASSLNGAYDPSMISIIDGTGIGQTRLIYQYDGTTKIATVDRNWKVTPDNTSEFVVLAHPGREHVNEGLAQAGTINTITLNALASDDNDAYNHQVVFLRGGTGEDQVNIVGNYNGTTKVATMAHNWIVAPDSTTSYVMLPTQVPIIDTVGKVGISASGIDAAALAPDTNTYQAKVWMFDDDTATTDRYAVIFFKNGQPITTGITSPTIQIFQVADGVNLVATTTMVEIGSTGTYRHTETSNRIVNGAAYIARAEAIIDSATRTWYQPIGRDG